MWIEEYFVIFIYIYICVRLIITLLHLNVIWEAGWYFILQLFMSIFFNWISFYFFHLLYCNSCYVYYYCIWLGFTLFFWIFITEFLQFFPSKESVTGCDSSLEVSVILQCTSISRSWIIFLLLLYYFAVLFWSHNNSIALKLFWHFSIYTEPKIYAFN